MNVQDIYPVDKDKPISWLSVQENVLVYRNQYDSGKRKKKQMNYRFDLC